MVTKLKQFTVVNGELFHRKTGFKARYKMENIKITERFVYQLNKKTGEYKKIGTVGKFKTKRAEKHTNRYFKEKQRKQEKITENAGYTQEEIDYWRDKNKRDEEEYQEWYNKHEEERIEREREREREQQNEEVEEVTEEEKFVDVNDLSNSQIERGTKEYYIKEANIDIDKYHLMYQNFHLIADELLRNGLIDLNEYQDLIDKFEIAMEYTWSVQRDKVFNMLWDRLKSYYPEKGWKYMDVIGWMF